MSDETTRLRQAAQDGGQADRILKNKIFRKAMAELEAQLLYKFRRSTIEDDALRRDVRIALGVLDNLEDQIKLVATTGKASASALLKLEEKENRSE